MKKFLGLLLFFPLLVVAQQKPEELVHNSTSYVDDYANVYTAEQEKVFDRTIRSFFDTVQIALVTIKSFGDIEPYEYATRLGRHWGVGSKSNNGLVIVIGVDDHQMFAATGPGIEGDLTDNMASDMQYEYAIPYFKAGDYYGGSKALLDAYIHYLSPAAKEIRKQQELKQKEVSRKEWENTKNVLWTVLLVLLVMGVVFYIIYLIYKTAKEKEEQMKLFEEKRDAIRSKLASYTSLVSIGKYYGMPEANILEAKIAKMDNPKLEKPEDYDSFIDDFEAEEWKEAQAIQVVADIVGTAKNLIKQKNTPEELTRAWESYKKDLTNLIINRRNYLHDLEECFDYIRTIKMVRNLLEEKLKTNKYGSLPKFNEELSAAYTALDKKFLEFSTVVKKEKDAIYCAKHAKEIISAELSRKRQYCIAVGVENQTGMEDGRKLNAIAARLNEFTGEDIPRDFSLYLLLIEQLAQVKDSYNQHTSYLQKKKEQEEEEERKRAAKRRREEEEESERRRRSSSGFGSSSLGSSSSDSRSSFGGGSFSGGGGGSKW